MQHPDAHAAVWTALASVVGTSGPTDQVVAALRSPDMLAQWPLAADAFPAAAEHTRAGVEALLGSSDDAKAIDDDHFRLLRGPGMPIAVPWESVHRSRDHLLFDEQTDQVRVWYQRFHLEAPRLNVEPDDHISLELEFASRLLQLGMEAEDRGDTARAEDCYAAHDMFCREHLAQWGPKFFDQLTGGARTDFYRGVGKLGQGAMAQLLDELGRE